MSANFFKVEFFVDIALQYLTKKKNKQTDKNNEIKQSLYAGNEGKLNKLVSYVQITFSS